MLILGVDPGLRATGFALVEGGVQGVRLLDHGVIHTDGGAPLARRLHEIHAALTGLLIRMRPTQMAVEDLYAAQRFPRTAILMGHARGVICLAARQRKIPVMPLTPAEVKRATTANGNASKGQVQRATQALLGLRALPRPSHVADALGLAMTGLSRSGVALR